MTTEFPNSPSLPSYITILKWIFAQGLRGYEVDPNVAQIIAKSQLMSEIASQLILDSIAHESGRDRSAVVADIHRWAESIGPDAYAQALIPTRIVLDNEAITRARTEEAAHRAARVVIGLAARQRNLIRDAARAIGGWMTRKGERLPRWSSEVAEKAVEAWGDRLARAALASMEKAKSKEQQLRTRDELLVAAFGAMKRVPEWVRGKGGEVAKGRLDPYDLTDDHR